MRTMITSLVLLLSTSAQASDLIIPKFIEETSTSGINSIYEGEWEFMVGGGAASFDCNADGFADLLLAGGVGPANFYRNTSLQGSKLEFSKEASGLEVSSVTGAYPINIDSDEYVDVVLLRVGENLVMKGKGNCKFEQANASWNFDGGDAWSAAFAATWEKGESWPTLAIGNYINREEELSPWGSCTDNWLHRGSKDKFEKPLTLSPSFCALSMMFTDWNRSGTPSLRISNDREYYEGGQEQLWHVGAGETPTLFTEADGWKNLRIWGMGIASYDLNFDQYPEYFLTSMADNKLQSLTAPATDVKPDYKDIAFPSGVTAHRPFKGDDLRSSTAWHAQFEDMNNDGRADLFIAKGNVAGMQDFANRDPNNLLLQTADGRFVETADKAGVMAENSISRGAVVADLNRDGLLDLIVVNRWELAQVWRNTTPNAGHWLQIKIEQPSANRDAIGAWIEVKRGKTTMRREVIAGGGHASGQNGYWHFGLGAATEVNTRVIWPDGSTSPWTTQAADQFLTITKN